jgi:hypothetical protein
MEHRLMVNMLNQALLLGELTWISPETLADELIKKQFS